MMELSDTVLACPYRKFRPSLFTRVYVQLLDHDKPSQMWALSRKQLQETVILSWKMGLDLVSRVQSDSYVGVGMADNG